MGTAVPCDGACLMPAESHPCNTPWTVREDLDLRWNFHTSRLLCRWGPSYGYDAEVDPFPAYAHDVILVEQTLRQVWDVAPLTSPLTVWVADHEGVERTNGWTSYDDEWVTGDDDEEHMTRNHHIFLSGKRIPPHPAVTRYVVAHEYGHALVHDAQLHGILEDGWLEEYAQLRGIDHVEAAGGRWHAATEEIVACDFRVGICRIEPEYWPHRPASNPLEITTRDARATWHRWWTGIVDALREERDL